MSLLMIYVIRLASAKVFFYLNAYVSIFLLMFN